MVHQYSMKFNLIMFMHIKPQESAAVSALIFHIFVEN